VKSRHKANESNRASGSGACATSVPQAKSVYPGQKEPVEAVRFSGHVIKPVGRNPTSVVFPSASHLPHESHL